MDIAFLMVQYVLMTMDYRLISNLVLMWKFKDLSDESIKWPATSDNSLNPKLNYLIILNFE